MDEKEFLEKYDDSVYEKPSVTADINIFSVFDEQESNYRKLSTKKLKILLIRPGSIRLKECTLCREALYEKRRPLMKLPIGN